MFSKFYSLCCFQLYPDPFLEYFYETLFDKDCVDCYKMGGCEEHSTSCTNKTCKGHEVDIMHFSIGSAVPGRLYGGNPLDNRDGNGGDR